MTADTRDIVERLRAYIPLASYEGVVLAHIKTFTEAADEIERLRASSKQAGPGGWNTALEEAAKAVECIGVQAMNEDFVRGAREFRKGAANVIRALKASPAAAQPEPTDDTAAKQRHKVRVKAEGFDQVLTGPVELMKPPEPKASSPLSPKQQEALEWLEYAEDPGCEAAEDDRYRKAIKAMLAAPHSAPDVVEALVKQLQFAVENLEGIRDGTDCPSSVIIRKSRKLLSSIASAGTPGERG